jgi:hypothetical protein
MDTLFVTTSQAFRAMDGALRVRCRFRREATSSDLRSPPYHQPMRSSISVGLGLVLLLGACTSDDASPPSPMFGVRTETYHDPAGWSVAAPVSWTVLPFETTKGEASAVGVQISNVPLPGPRIHPGLPIQTSVLPPQGVSVVIATDDDSRNVQSPPPSPPSPPLSLSESGFAEGSCIAGETPCLSTLGFTVADKTLLISLKTGPLAKTADMAILALLVGSIRADS